MTARRMGVRDRLETETRAADAVVEPPRADRDAAGRPRRRAPARPHLARSHDRFGNRARNGSSGRAGRAARAARRSRSCRALSGSWRRRARSARHARRSRRTSASSAPSAKSEQAPARLRNRRSSASNGMRARLGDARQARIDMRDAHRNARPELGEKIDDRAEAAKPLRVRRRRHEQRRVDADRPAAARECRRSRAAGTSPRRPPPSAPA